MGLAIFFRFLSGTAQFQESETFPNLFSLIHSCGCVSPSEQSYFFLVPVKENELTDNNCWKVAIRPFKVVAVKEGQEFNFFRVDLKNL